MEDSRIGLGLIPAVSAPRRRLAGSWKAWLSFGLAGFGLLVWMWAGDLLYAWRPAGPLQRFWELTDPLVHCGVGLIVLAPVWLRQAGRKRIALAVLSGAVAVLIDLDHVIAARSFSLYAITHLDGRPFTHSLWAAAALAVIVLVVRRQWAEGWVVFGAITSHIVRDAFWGGVSYLAWPARTVHFSLGEYFSLELLLLAFSFLLVILPVGAGSPEGELADRQVYGEME
jgi:membrane-bound metal-dependent hydrolase YbcI (DUF457 family)